jgi:hypothetical protein
VRHPEKGEARAAADKLRDRFHSLTPEGVDHTTAEVNPSTGEWRGDQFAMLAMYGDLFDIGEVAEIAQTPVYKFILDIASGIAPETALRSMYLLAAAHGVLIERGRWER